MDQALRDTIAQRFPGALAYLNNPEVATLLEQAVDPANDWSPEVFQAKLQATAWYRKTTDAQRIAFSIEQTNPGEASSRVNALAEQIQTFLYQLGAPTMSSNDLHAHAWQAFREGWTPQDLKANIANIVQPATSSLGSMNIKKLASDYMVNLTDDKLTDLTRRAFSGQIDETGLRSMFAQQSSSQFPALADLIAKGTTPADYFDPYKQIIAKYTDTPPAQIDFTSPTWNKIVSYATPDGKMRPMTIDEATKYVRSTDEFANSSTGQAETASYQKQFEQMLGARR